MNFEVGDNLVQLLGMTSEETFHRWDDNDSTDTLAVFGMGMLGPNTMTMGAVGGIDEQLHRYGRLYLLHLPKLQPALDSDFLL